MPRKAADLIEHPEVERGIEYQGIWPADKPFPLTPLEAWYVLQGWAVRPSAGLPMDTLLELPGKIEGGDGWVWLWQA